MTKRVVICFGVMGLLFCLLGVKIFYIMNESSIVQVANSQRQYTLNIDEVRGVIYDFKFLPLVNRGVGYKGIIYPSAEGSAETIQFLKNYENGVKQFESGKPFMINMERPVNGIPGLAVFKTVERYSANQLAPHIIGYINSDNTGISGIEKSFDKLLKDYSVMTSVTFGVDAYGRYIKGTGAEKIKESVGAGGVVLTLDSVMQDICERAGEMYIEKGAIVVLDAKTAKIRASASFPSYDYQNIASDIEDTENSPMINRAFLPYNAGSIFKVATAAAALENGISKETYYNCTGEINVKGQIFKCHKAEGHGWIDMEKAFEVSCNPYFIELADKIGAENLLKTAKDFGFGKSNILANGIISSSGVLPSIEQIPNPADLANISFGQGLLTVTPLQAAQMICAVCNDGRSLVPSLIEGITEDGKTIIEQKTAAPITAVSSKTADILKEFMIQAVMGRSDQLATPEYNTAGGKTGTAQTGKKDENGIEIDQAWFAGFFPAENPEYIAVILVENGISGNLSAAPVFKEIADTVALLNQN